MKKECQEISDHITALADQEISPEKVEKINLHLAHCQDCRHKLDEIKKIQEWMRKSWPDIKPSQGFDQSFMDALKKEKASEKRRTSWLFAPRKWVAVCALVFFLIAGGVFLTQNKKELTLKQYIISTEFELISNMHVIRNLDALENYEMLLAMNEIGKVIND